MMKNIKIKSALLLYLVGCILIAKPLYSANEPVPGKAEDTKEVRELLDRREVLRKSFLDEIYTQAKEVRTKLDSSKDEEEKKAIVEEFRVGRLKRLEEFQTQDRELSKQIEDARLKTK